MKRSLLIIGFFVIIGLTICGCAYYGPNTSKDTIPSDRYVAILEEYTNKSTLIGTPPYTPIRPLPIPTPVPVFDYDNSLGQLRYELGPYGITVNDSFKALIGTMPYFDTPTTWGYMGLRLAGVSALPYTIEGVFTIEKVAANGTMIAVYENRSIYLKPGENWTAVISSKNITGAYLANTMNDNSFDYNNMTEMPWPVTNEVSITITNKGIYNKSVLDGSPTA